MHSVSQRPINSSILIFTLCNLYFHNNVGKCGVIFTAQCYAERGIATAYRTSIRLSVTLMYCNDIGGDTSKIIIVD